jgi:hypothetical protein
MNQNGVPPHELQLKEGCICSLMRNMSVWKHLVKNTRMVVECIHQHFVQVRVINNRTGTLGESHCIPRLQSLNFGLIMQVGQYAACNIPFASHMPHFQWLCRSDPGSNGFGLASVSSHMGSCTQLCPEYAKGLIREYCLIEIMRKGLTSNVVYRELLL